MDVCFIMDSSGSVDVHDLRFILQFMKDIVNSFTEIGEGGAKVKPWYSCTKELWKNIFLSYLCFTRVNKTFYKMVFPLQI